MRETVKAFLSNKANRRLLMSAGAYIAGAYLGWAYPGGIEALHDAFQYVVSLSPFVDPLHQIGALYDGALHQSAAAIHTLGDWLSSVGVELTHRVREDVDRARHLLGPALDQAKSLFVETWHPITEAAVSLRDQIRNSLPSAQSVYTWTKETGKAAFDLLMNAVEAYGVYDLGKKIYDSLFKRAKKSVQEEMIPAANEAPAVTERTINLNLNTAVGGGPVVDAALRNKEIRFNLNGDPTSGISALDSDRIIWVSDQLRFRLSEQLTHIGSGVSGKDQPISINRPPVDRLEDIMDQNTDLAHRDRFPDIHWGESDLSKRRLQQIRCGTRIEAHPEIGLRVPVRNDIRLVLGEDGFLRAEKGQPPSPDIMN